MNRLNLKTFILSFFIFIYANSQVKEVNLDLSKGEKFNSVRDLGEEGFIVVTESSRMHKGKVLVNYHSHHFNNKLKEIWTSDMSKKVTFDMKRADISGSKKYAYSLYYKTYYNMFMKRLQISGQNEGEEKVVPWKHPKKSINPQYFAGEEDYHVVFKKKGNSVRNGDSYGWITYNSELDVISETSFDLLDPNTGSGNKSWMRSFTYQESYIFLDYSFLDTKNKGYKIKVKMAVVNNDGVVKVVEYISSSSMQKVAPSKFESFAVDIDRETGLIYLGYIVENKKRFVIDCFDLEGNHVFDTKGALEGELEFEGKKARKFYAIKAYKDGTLAYQMVSPWTEGGAQTFLFEKATGKSMGQSIIDYKVGPTVPESRIIGLNDVYIYLKNEGRVGKALELKAKEIEKRKDKKAASYTYLNRKTDEILILFIENEITILKFFN